MTVEEQLLAIRARAGYLTPALVVEEARDPESPLHGRFEWDDGEAAEQYRQIQARRLIRLVRVTYSEGDEGGPSRSVRGFHAVVQPESGRHSYEPLAELKKDSVQMKILLQQMRREWLAMRRRYEHMHEFWELIEATERGEITGTD